MKIVIFFLLVIIGCLVPIKIRTLKSIITCDCEKRESNYFIGNSTSGKFSNINFDNLETASDFHSKSGKNCVRLTKEFPYGMTYTINNVRIKEYYRVKVWRHKSNSNGCIIISSDNIEELYLAQHKSNNTIVDDWEQISIEFIIPKSANSKNIKVYVWNAGDTIPVYFDGLSIEFLPDTVLTTKHEKSLFTDSRDNQNYEIIKYGEHWWMNENLNFQLNDSCLCYENSTKNCDEFGRLYDFNTAQVACPIGYRIPTDNEWKELEQLIGMNPNEIEKYGDRGYNESIALREFGSAEFNAKLAGAFINKGFYNLNKSTYFWTSTEIDSNHAYCREISYRTDIGRFKDKKSMHFSVRCIKSE